MRYSTASSYKISYNLYYFPPFFTSTILFYLIIVLTTVLQTTYRLPSQTSQNLTTWSGRNDLNQQHESANYYTSTGNDKSTARKQSSVEDEGEIHQLYKCPSYCNCSYDLTWKKLEIECNTDHSPEPENSLNLTDGIRHLILRNADLSSIKSQTLVLPPVVQENSIVILEIENCVIEPISFFNSQVFRNSRQSLYQIEIHHGKLVSTPTLDSLLYDESGIGALEYLAGLKELNSLSICDTETKIALLVLRSLPPSTVHIKLNNNYITELESSNFAHLSNSLLSLNLGKNHIKYIPRKFLSAFPNLIQLDLSENSIEHLQEQVFVGLGNLERLNVSHNSIKYVDLEVFNPLPNVHVVDLSQNNIIQFFEPYFENNQQLTQLFMKNAWSKNTFINPDSKASSQMEMERLISTLRSVTEFDLSDNHMVIIPETLTHIPLLKVHLHGNLWQCNCQVRWVLSWLHTTNVVFDNNLWCYDFSHGEPQRIAPLVDQLKSISPNCTQKNIYNKYLNKYFTHLGLNTTLHCHRGGEIWPIITWITPSKQRITVQQNFPTDNWLSADHSNSNFSAHVEQSFPENLQPSIYGNLSITNVSKNDFGLYICVAQYEDLNITHYIHVGFKGVFTYKHLT